MADNLTFEKANAQLEQLVNKMESDTLSIEDSMKTYEEAFKLLAFCYEKIDGYKGQIVDINTRLEQLKKNEDLFND